MKFAGLFMCAVLAALVCPTEAFADVAGRYETMDDDAVIDMEMTFETDLNGNVRFQMAALGGYYLLQGGELFVITKENDEFIVIRTAEMLVVQREVMERLGWKDPFSDTEYEPPIAAFAPMDEEVVNGRQGIGYGIVAEGMDEPVYASIVIGGDPELAPLGQAMASANQAAIKGMGSLGTMLGMMNDEMVGLLQSGAPLRMLRIELTDVSFEQIPESRFELPNTPLTIEQLRARLDNTVEPPPTLPPRVD